VNVKLSADEEAGIRKWIDEIGVAGFKMGEGVIKDFGDTPPL
jgi:hypothetical protein